LSVDILPANYSQLIWAESSITNRTTRVPSNILTKRSYTYALEYKGILLYQLGHFREALANFDKALKSEPCAYAYGTLENKGLALYKLGDYTEALSTLNMALRLNLGDTTALFNKALVLATLGFHTHDVGDLNTALQNLKSTSDRS
jgi:tetratricopeptide (TPR) repeat protein